MIQNTRSIVLWSRRSREADKVVGLFTRERGRLTARATSAARSTAKFAALTEPFVESEIALFLRSGVGWGKIVGGRIERSFPSLRTDLARSTAASWVCEVTCRLTPEEQKSTDKYDLICDTLAALERAKHLGMIRLAFAVRFLKFAGFGLENQEAWRTLAARCPEWADRLEASPLAELGDAVWGGPEVDAVERLAGSIVADHLNRPLQVNRFRQMAGVEI